MKFEDIMKEAEADAKLDYTELAKEAVNLTNLIVKWSKVYSLEKISLAQINKEYNKVYKERWQYYLGKAPDEYYQKFPALDLKILRTDVDIYLKSDDVLSEIRDKQTLQEQKISFLENFIKSLHSRGFNIKAAIDYLQFTNGG